MTRPVFAALVLTGAAVWFGVRLGPRLTTPPQTTPQAASVAASQFVRSAAERNGGAQVEIDSSSAQETDTPDLWRVSGSGTATMPGRQGLQRFDFETRQEWRPVSHVWHLKSVDLIRARSK